MVNMNTNGVTEPRIGKLECFVGVLTALMLIGILGALTSHLFSCAPRNQSIHNGLPGVVSIDRNETRHGSQRPSNSATNDAKLAPRQALKVEKTPPDVTVKLEPIATETEPQEAPAPAGSLGFARQAP